ncbi:MAG: NAD(P)/FAD-dependent oxidoreductase [Deltaproteobacteria bacterium]|nr:NAD(P)/FAD-dependent oxidoreductase [Deltaproteobacteria bacterium]
MLREADVVVIGAGVVGIACAVELAKRGHFVTVLERHPRIAEEGSSRNSGVIHAGLHYATGSLKQRLCVRGRELLYERCKRFGLAHKKLGKLIVARDAHEAEVLATLEQRAHDNGAGPVRLLDGIELAMMEETVRGHAALLVEESGILRTQEYVRSLAREAESLRVEVLVGMEVTSIERDVDAESRDRWVVRIAGGDRDSGGWRCDHVIDAAGLGADHVARMAGVDTDAHGLTQRFCKGTWMALDERFRKAVGRLLYPTPHVVVAEGGRDGASPTALGIHLTRDLEGFLFAGPDAEWIDTPDFDLDASRDRAERYAAAVAMFLPDVEPRHLVPLVAGVRPKLHGPTEPAADFVIRECTELGAPRFVLLAGIESPGLTASLAIAEEVCAIVRS